MTSRLREDERNERAIRSLLKLPENRRCINCNSLVPQYVCTNFWTFICTTCSGIHREFTHRVKSVSMAKFTSQEVSALQGGGNASAKEIYFKEWDSQRQSYPDSSNVERLRNFIKHVYVDRRYSGGTSLEKPPTLKMSRFQGYVIQGEAENQGGSKSPPFKPTAGGKSDDRGSKNNEDERQSPVYNQEFGRSPAERTDTVDDWRREDRFKVELQSPDRPRDREMLGSPIVRPVRDILGDKSSPLRVIKPPKVNGLRPLDNKTVSSTSLASSSGNPTEKRTEGSLIDFNSAPDPSSATVQHTAPSAPVVAQPTTTLNDNWANFDSVQEVKTSDAPSNTDFLDVLSELSVPSSSLGGISVSTSAPAQQGNILMSSFGATPVSAPISQSSVAYGGAHAESQGIDIKENAKTELPVDLFSSFAAAPPGWFHAPQYGMGFNMQYNVQMPMPPAYMQPSNPLNQFGVNELSPVQSITFPSMAPLQGALPNMLPQQGIQRTTSLGEWLPTQPSHPLSYSNVQRTSSLGTPFSPWMPTQSSHPISKSPQILSYGSAIPSGPFMGQEPPNIQPFSRVGVDNNSSVSFNFSQQQQQHGSTFSSAGPNPFG